MFRRTISEKFDVAFSSVFMNLFPDVTIASVKFCNHGNSILHFFKLMRLFVYRYYDLFVVNLCVHMMYMNAGFSIIFF